MHKRCGTVEMAVKGELKNVKCAWETRNARLKGFYYGLTLMGFNPHGE